MAWDEKIMSCPSGSKSFDLKFPSPSPLLSDYWLWDFAVFVGRAIMVLVNFVAVWTWRKQLIQRERVNRVKDEVCFASWLKEER